MSFYLESYLPDLFLLVGSFPLVSLFRSHRSLTTSWTTCRMLSRSSSVSSGRFRCPVLWTNRTSLMTSYRCPRTTPPWWPSSNQEASDPAWARLVSPSQTQGWKKGTMGVFCSSWDLNLFIPIFLDFGGVRPGQPGRGLPVRSVSLDMNVPSQQPSLQYPIRSNSPYTVMQQQQGMLGGHSMMPSQAGMGNTGRF